MWAKAKDIMTSPIISVRPDATIDEVLELLMKHHISGLPVLDADSRLVGVVSELDLLKLLYNRLEIENLPLSRVQSTHVTTVDEDDRVIDVAEIFMEKPIRRVPVLRDGKVVGIISRRDVVRHIHELRRRVAAEIKSRAARPAAKT